MTDNNNNNHECWRTDGNNVDANDWLGSRNNQPLRIRTNNTERMSITPVGNVGIGTGTAPIQRTLHVRGSEIHSEGGVAGFSFGNRETPDPFAPGTAPGERWVWYASGRTARLWSLGDKIAVTPAGSVGIGTTNPAFLLDVVGQAHATNFVATSDARFKTNVKQLTNVLERLARIRGVSFQWNELYESLGRSTGRAEIGVIAQEVEAIFPELVTAWGDESYKGVDYGRLSGVLIEAIKELKAQNEVLRSRIEALEGV